jgi:hypothetical protein
MKEPWKDEAGFHSSIGREEEEVVELESTDLALIMRVVEEGQMVERVYFSLNLAEGVVEGHCLKNLRNRLTCDRETQGLEEAALGQEREEESHLRYSWQLLFAGLLDLMLGGIAGDFVGDSQMHYGVSAAQRQSVVVALRWKAEGEGEGGLFQLVEAQAAFLTLPWWLVAWESP